MSPSGGNPPRPLPRPNPETAHFWEGTRNHQLLLQRCVTCERPWFPPQPFCPRCASDDWELQAASGAARLVSYVVSHRDGPGLAAPYVIALVQLAEGPRMLTNLSGTEADPAALGVGMALQVHFEQVNDEIVLPLFGPSDEPVTVTVTAEASRREPLGEDAIPPAARQRSEGAAIIGASETTRLGQIDDLTPLGLHLDAARNALADAGLGPADIDGVACAGVSPVEVAFGLGITPTWVDGTMVGGSSFMLHVRHALAALSAGMATCVLITHGESGRSRVGGFPGARRSLLAESFELPYGVMGPPTLFTLPALAWMDRYGITEAELASVAVAQRRWAADNPRALRREPVTVDDVLDSPMVAWPFRRLMCCLVTDGGGALVLTTTSRAADAESPVHVIGSGESAETPMVSQMDDLTRSRAFEVSARRALGEAGVGVNDIDHLMAYDAFAHTPCYALVALGVVGPGEAPAFVAEGNTSPGGRLPMNTNGGGLSYTHTGMYGMFAILESVRQVRGRAPAQVPGVELSVAHGVGGMFAASGTLVLADQPR